MKSKLALWAFLSAWALFMGVVSAPAAQEPSDESRPVLESSWQDNDGNTHVVRTDCRRYTSVTRCANAHKRAIEILKKVMAETEETVAH